MTTRGGGESGGATGAGMSQRHVRAVLADHVSQLKARSSQSWMSRLVHLRGDDSSGAQAEWALAREPFPARFSGTCGRILLALHGWPGRSRRATVVIRPLGRGSGCRGSCHFHEHGYCRRIILRVPNSRPVILLLRYFRFRMCFRLGRTFGNRLPGLRVRRERLRPHQEQAGSESSHLLVAVGAGESVPSWKHVRRRIVLTLGRKFAADWLSLRLADDVSGARCLMATPRRFPWRREAPIRRFRFVGRFRRSASGFE